MQRVDVRGDDFATKGSGVKGKRAVSNPIRITVPVHVAVPVPIRSETTTTTTTTAPLRRSGRRCSLPLALQDYELPANVSPNLNVSLNTDAKTNTNMCAKVNPNPNVDVSESLKRWNVGDVPVPAPALARSAEPTSDTPSANTRKRSSLASLEYRPPPALRATTPISIASKTSSSTSTPRRSPLTSPSHKTSTTPTKSLRLVLRRPSVRIHIPASQQNPQQMIATPRTAESFLSDSSGSSSGVEEDGGREYFPPQAVGMDVDGDGDFGADWNLDDFLDDDDDDDYSEESSPPPPQPTLLETPGAFDRCRTVPDLIQRYEDPQFDQKIDLYNIEWSNRGDFGTGFGFGGPNVAQRLNQRGYRGGHEYERYRQRYLERSAHANWLRFLASGLKGRDAWWHL